MVVVFSLMDSATPGHCLSMLQTVAGHSSILVPVRALFPFQIHMDGHQLNENCGKTLDMGRMLVMRCTLSSTEAAEEPVGQLWSPYM